MKTDASGIIPYLIRHFDIVFLMTILKQR